MKKVNITIEQLQSIIKEGVARLHRKSLIENRLRQIGEELAGTNIYEGEVASPEVMGILNGYLEAALWTDEEEVGPGNIEDDISSDAKIDAYQDVKKFMLQAGDLIDNLDPSQVGHDLWLTRNGHGAGFWDRGLGDVGEKLSDIARGMGSKHMFVGDDGFLHIQ